MSQAGRDVAFAVRCGYPNASDSLVEHVLWERTPFPFTKMTLKSVYKAAYRLYRADQKCVELCDFCDRIAINKGVCQRCDDALRKASENQ